MKERCPAFGWCDQPAGHEQGAAPTVHHLDLANVQGESAHVVVELLGDEETEYLAVRFADPAHSLPVELSGWQADVLAHVLSGLGPDGIHLFTAALKRGADLLNREGS